MSEQSNGLKLELRPARSQFAEGELPEVDALITNVSPQEITFCKYLVQHRLLSTERAGAFECFPFGPTPTPELTAEDFTVLKPGESVSFKVPAATGEKYGWLPAARLSPEVSAEDALPGFPKGEYELYAHVGDFVSFYDNPPGMFGYNRRRVNILDEVPRAANVPKPSNVWNGDLLAKTSVSFS